MTEQVNEEELKVLQLYRNFKTYYATVRTVVVGSNVGFPSPPDSRLVNLILEYESGEREVINV